MPAKNFNTDQNEIPRVSEFKGLNNVIDPLHLGLDSFTQADNIDISVSRCVQRAQGWPETPGYSATELTGAYGTEDLQRLYVIDNGSLLQLDQNLNVIATLATLTDTTDPVYFAEVNGVTFYTNGTDYGMLTAAGWSPWGIPAPTAPLAVLSAGGNLSPGVYQFVCTLVDGNGMESSNSDVVVVSPSSGGTRVVLSEIPQVAGYTTNVYVTQHDSTQFQLLIAGAGAAFTMTGQEDLGIELPFWNLNTPRGSRPAFFAGRLYCAEYFPASDLTMLWRSKQLHYHHFDLVDGVPVPGNILDFKSTRETHFLGALRNEKLTARGVADTLIVGTDREVYTYDEDQLVKICNYGLVPGSTLVELHGKMYFWTQRGFCRAMPFENFTQTTVSVPPGLTAAAAVLEEDGTRRYVVALTKGGTAYNPFVKT